MPVDEAAAMLAPLLRTNELFGLGPFRRPSDKPMSLRWIRARLLYERFARFFWQFWWIRGVCLLGLKFFLARRSLGAAIGDLIRNTVGTLGLFHISRNAKKLNEVIELLDEFAHEKSSARWLSRYAFRMNVGIWVYVITRIIVDSAALYFENLLPVYIRTDLFTDPVTISASVYPWVVAYALVDLALNRLVISVGLCLSPCTYIGLNFLMYIKFRKLDDDIRQCLARNSTPAEIKRLRLIHAELCQVVLFMDETFSPLAIFFHGGVVAGFCGETIRLIERYGKGVDASELVSFFNIMFSLLFLAVLIFLVTISTAEVCDCPKKSIDAVNELLQDENTAKRDVMAGTQQIRLLLSQMGLKSVQMTAWRFYKLDRAALMTTYGASISYVSLVLQSAPETN